MLETGRSGWYFRVLREGHVQAGQTLDLVQRPCPRWTIEQVAEVMLNRKDDVSAAVELAEVSALPESWRAALRRRATG